MSNQVSLILSTAICFGNFHPLYRHGTVFCFFQLTFDHWPFRPDLAGKVQEFDTVHSGGGHPCLKLTLPTIKVRSGLSPYCLRPCRAHTQNEDIS